MNRFSRLTTGQAVVRFLAHQFAERDGHENRFIEGIWAIFGHGNVAGLGQGIVEWDVPVAEVSGEERTRKTRETYEKATENQRPVFT